MGDCVLKSAIDANKKSRQSNQISPSRLGCRISQLYHLLERYCHLALHTYASKATGFCPI
ncbi:unnamed protein product [Larinioides sclopetarius]|uniref:Uncharacterized protein n=1 Tax=Larinioides sclopetarius TaxID=280406 RepID=A0AAV1YSL0_9ARAC